MPTKRELTDQAEKLGYHVPSSWNKDRIQEAIDAGPPAPEPEPSEPIRPPATVRAATPNGNVLRIPGGPTITGRWTELPYDLASRLAERGKVMIHGEDQL